MIFGKSHIDTNKLISKNYFRNHDLISFDVSDKDFSVKAVAARTLSPKKQYPYPFLLNGCSLSLIYNLVEIMLENSFPLTPTKEYMSEEYWAIIGDHRLKVVPIGLKCAPRSSGGLLHIISLCFSKPDVQLSPCCENEIMLLFLEGDPML